MLFRSVLHEMGHSTGSENRLHREYGYEFGSEKYAQEELVAELSALFVESDLGLNLQAEHYEDHSDYLKSWISALKNDYSVLFTAVAEAEKATDRIISRYKKKELEIIEGEVKKSIPNASSYEITKGLQLTCRF